MNVSKEELLHIAKLADLEIKENEIPEYLKNLEDILNYTNVIDEVNVDNCEETIGANDNYNVFRKDEVKQFDNVKGIMDNAQDIENHMFKIPKVINEE